MSATLMQPKVPSTRTTTGADRIVVDNEWFQKIIEVCEAAAQGDFEPRVLHCDANRPEGRLAIAINDLLDRADAFIREAAEAASRTCEVCGAPGRRSKQGGWFLVACQRHDDARSTVLPGAGEQT